MQLHSPRCSLLLLGSSFSLPTGERGFSCSRPQLKDRVWWQLSGSPNLVTVKNRQLSSNHAALPEAPAALTSNACPACLHWRGDVPHHTCPAMHWGNPSPAHSIRQEARSDLQKQERRCNTECWMSPAWAAWLAAARGALSQGSIAPRCEARGTVKGRHPSWSSGMRMSSQARATPGLLLQPPDGAAGETKTSHPQEPRQGAAAAADTGSSGGVLHVLPRCPCGVLFIFPVPWQCPDLTCVS